MVTAFGNNEPEYGAQHKSSCLKYAIEFLQKYCWNRKSIFAPFTLYLNLHALCKLVGEIDTRKVDNCDKYQGGTYYSKKLYVTDPWD